MNNSTELMDLLHKIYQKLEELNINLQPETFTWKLKNRTLIENCFLKQLKSDSQKIAYVKMVNDIALKHNVELKDMENWPTEPLRHLFYCSCKWIGIKDGRDKKKLSEEIFEITSNKRGKITSSSENSKNEIKLFDNDVNNAEEKTSLW